MIDEAPRMDSRLHDPALTPLEEVGELRSSIRSPNRRPRPESSLAGEDLIGSDLGERRRRELRRLERDARIANNRLQRARIELEDERSCSPRNSKSTSSPEVEKENQQHRSVSDENIQQVIRDLRTPTHREGETQDEYNTCLAASSRLCLEREEKDNAARKKLRQQEKLRIEAESLLLKIKEAECKHHRKTGGDKDRRESTQVRKDTHQNYREIRRREHYREWLATQNVLDSMRQADIRDSGRYLHAISDPPMVGIHDQRTLVNKTRTPLQDPVVLGGLIKISATDGSVTTRAAAPVRCNTLKMFSLYLQDFCGFFSLITLKRRIIILGK